MKRDWTLGPVLVACVAAGAAAGALWLSWGRWPVGTAQGAVWAVLTASCVWVSTVKLRAELAHRDARLDAYDLASMRTDLDQCGPASPAAGSKVVDGFDATLTTECGATVRINTANLTTQPRRLDYGWCTVHDDTRDCRLMKLEYDRPPSPAAGTRAVGWDYERWPSGPELYDQDAEQPWVHTPCGTPISVLDDGTEWCPTCGTVIDTTMAAEHEDGA